MMNQTIKFGHVVYYFLHQFFYLIKNDFTGDEEWQNTITRKLMANTDFSKRLFNMIELIVGEKEDGDIPTAI